MIVILYIMDSLRPDFLSCYGHPKQTSPQIDRLAQEGVMFTQAYAQATWTRPSGASILSSAYPSVHGVNDLSNALPAYVPVIPEYLRSHGFRTIAISSMGNVSPHFGFEKGFDVFIELYKEKSVAEKRRKVFLQNEQWEPHFKGGKGGDWVPIATSEDIHEVAISLLKARREEDVFIFIWSLDTHGPYFHRDMKLAQFYPDDVLWVTEDVAKAKSDDDIGRLMQLYRDMIYYNDHHLGRFIEELKERKLYDETFLIVTGDHGEAFGEHGFNSHGREPYDELLKVPLIMKFPFSRFHGRVSSIVQHVDLMPTLLDFLKIPTGNNRSMQGRSLLPLLQDQAPVNEYAFAEHWPGRQYVSHIAFRTEEYKLIAVRRQEVTLRQWLRDRRKLWPSPWFVYKPLSLYDLKKDPGEKVNIIRAEENRTRHLHDRVKTILRENEVVARTLKKEKGVEKGPDTRELKKTDEEVSKQLKALGYFD